MRRLGNTLVSLYACAAVVLMYCAKVSGDHHATGYAVFFGGCAVLFAVAIFHHGYHRDELRAARVQLERALRPSGPPAPPTSAAEEVVAVALAGACCEVWWATAGAEHDPEHCTRKDQTT